MNEKLSTPQNAPRLPPGQRALAHLPRFGVAEFARRPLRNKDIHIEISAAPDRTVVITALELGALTRITLTADFHCAAGWSHRNTQWSGFRFTDIWNTFVTPIDSVNGNRLAVLRGQDGYRTALPLADLLAPDVLIADRLNDEPLTVEHGAPVRLIAPAHYGYKSAKHLSRIELRADDGTYRPLLPRILDHPRARVELEERGQFLPGWMLRYLFRPLIQPLIRKLERITTPE
ncbi:MAG: molybdopterin-dependent oxidoreductase [Povalibacter sp.]